MFITKKKPEAVQVGRLEDSPEYREITSRITEVSSDLAEVQKAIEGKTSALNSALAEKSRTERMADAYLEGKEWDECADDSALSSALDELRERRAVLTTAKESLEAKREKIRAKVSAEICAKLKPVYSAAVQK